MSRALGLAAASALVAAAGLCWPVPRRPPGRPRPAVASPTRAAQALPDVVLIDLVVAALAAGLPAASAVAAAREAASQDAAAAGVAHPLPVAAERAFLLAERTGASAAELLRRFAADERSARQAAVTAEAGRLGVRLVVPLGLTVLPAFVLLGVVPVVIGLARQLWVP